MQQYCEIATPKGVMRGFFHVPHRKEFPVLLIFHGFTGQCTGTKFSYVSLSRLLEAQGVGTLRMDFLGSGESDLTFKEMTFDDELSCARILLEELKKMPQVTDIYVLGHSMGGAMASSYVSKNKDKVNGLILLGSYIYGDVSDQDTLTIYGSLNTSVKKKIDYKKNIVVIQGGNHANFGNYGHQKGDAKATISRKSQQKQTIKAIDQFIKKRLN